VCLCVGFVMRGRDLGVVFQMGQSLAPNRSHAHIGNVTGNSFFFLLNVFQCMVNHLIVHHTSKTSTHTQKVCI
jgi:hypothetical protein